LLSTSGQQSSYTTGTGTYIDVFGAATPANNFVAFRTTNTPNAAAADIETMRITSTGVTVTGNMTVTGTVTAATVLNAVYQDVAEWVDANGELAPGTVVVLDPAHDNRVRRSASSYDTTVAGVVSAMPGVVLGVGAPGKEKIATTGRVKVRVDATKAPINIGDLLVTSDVEGTAMKSQPIDVAGTKLHRPGTVIGKALQPLAAGRGEILVLLSLQ
jgi:hypothetical protein